MTPDLFDRRSFLKIGSLSVFGSLAWGEIARLRAQAAERPKKEISVIHVMLSGGMSHMDTLEGTSLEGSTQMAMDLLKELNGVEGVAMLEPAITERTNHIHFLGYARLS